MSSTPPAEPLLIEVNEIELIHDDESRFPPSPVATILVNGEEHNVTLDPLELKIGGEPDIRLSFINTFPGSNGELPAAEVVLFVDGEEEPLPLNPETMHVDVAKSRPSFELSEAVLQKINGAIDDHMEAENLSPVFNELSVSAMADGLEFLTGQTHDLRKAGEQYELRKRDEESNWQQVEQYSNLTEAHQDIVRREAVARLEIEDPARARALTEMLTQLDQHPEQPQVLDMTPDPEPVHAGFGQVAQEMKGAVAAGSLGKPHDAHGQRLSAEVIEKTLALMLKQLDAEDEKPAVAVKR